LPRFRQRFRGLPRGPASVRRSPSRPSRRPGARRFGQSKWQSETLTPRQPRLPAHRPGVPPENSVRQ